jgi:SAM-dependent methyltransferase
MPDSFDQKWDAIHREREWGDVADNHLVRFVRRNFPKPTTGKSALDLGCGAGAQTKFLADEGFRTLGIDASPTVIERNWHQQTASRLGYSIGDVTRLPFNRSFDLIVDVCCLQHVGRGHVEDAFVGIYKALEADGLFFSVTARWDHSYTRDDTLLRTMRRDEVLDLYNSAGFHIIGFERAFHTDNGAQISHWIITAAKHGPEPN